MRSRAGFFILGTAVLSLILSSCNGGGQTGGGSAPSKTSNITLAGNSVARTVYEKGLIPAFKTAYEKAHPGQSVDFTESYEGSGAQERAIEAGLKADIAALSLSPEIDKLATNGLASKDWAKDANHGIPATSVVVLVVRAGNPKGIKDWSDLYRDGIDVVLPNPDTSGAAQWNIAAIDAYAKNNDFAKGAAGSLDPSLWVLKQIRSHVKAFGKSGKEAQQIFSSGTGDVMVGWECEALDRKAAGDQIDIVYPSTTIQMEPPVAVITPKGQQPNPAAAEFVKFLSTSDAQKIYVQYHYRPRDASVLAAIQQPFAPIQNLVTIDKLGGWETVQKRLFGPEGLWAKAAE